MVVIITVINIILFHHPDTRRSRFVMMIILLPLQNAHTVVHNHLIDGTHRPTIEIQDAHSSVMKINCSGMLCNA
jgi:hypothetical protein